MNVDDAVCVNVKCDLNLGNTAGCRRNTNQLELTCKKFKVHLNSILQILKIMYTTYIMYELPMLFTVIAKKFRFLILTSYSLFLICSQKKSPRSLLRFRDVHHGSRIRPFFVSRIRIRQFFLKLGSGSRILQKRGVKIGLSILCRKRSHFSNEI
jgi:hypothetical protein